MAVKYILYGAEARAPPIGMNRSRTGAGLYSEAAITSCPPDVVDIAPDVLRHIASRHLMRRVPKASPPTAWLAGYHAGRSRAREKCWTAVSPASA